LVKQQKLRLVEVELLRLVVEHLLLQLEKLLQLVKPLLKLELKDNFNFNIDDSKSNSNWWSRFYRLSSS